MPAPRFRLLCPECVTTGFALESNAGQLFNGTSSLPGELRLIIRKSFSNVPSALLSSIEGQVKIRRSE